MARKSFGFKDTYSIDAEMKAQEWQASSMVAEKEEGQDGEDSLSLQDRQLKSAEEYAQTLTNVKWASVDKVVGRLVALRQEVEEVLEMTLSTQDPLPDEEEQDGALAYDSVMGRLVVRKNSNDQKVVRVAKEGVVVEVVVLGEGQGGDVQETQPDGSSVSLSHGDRILTERFTDGFVSRLDRQQFLKTVQLPPEDGNILVQAIMHGPRKGHTTVQCMDGRCVILDELGNRSTKAASPRSSRRRRSSLSLEGADGGTSRSRRSSRSGSSPRPPSSPSPRRSKGGSGAGRTRTRTASTDLAVLDHGGQAPSGGALIKKKASFFRQLTAEKLVPLRPDEEGEDDQGDDEAFSDATNSGNIQWRCIRRLWIHSKPATLSGLVRHMEVGETVTQIRKVQKSVGRTWIEFIDSKDTKSKKKVVRYVATTSKLGLKTLIPIFNT